MFGNLVKCGGAKTICRNRRKIQAKYLNDIKGVMVGRSPHFRALGNQSCYCILGVLAIIR
jgi:hypothetical protein